ncbi:unnamed protein product [Rotaria socialis]|uniref:Protein kinase domain-containing protein n=1 Tax=Rotaria socialis TaxID=392032 RepID=A0A817KDK2_9BILA|nr:unnamed protein product [Rotaria socialis]
MIDSGAYGQVILAYDYLFQTKVLYRYLKASNIFVDLDGHVRIEPFCFARVSKRRGKCTNDSVCIRWYRASELVLCDGTYTSAMDMWSTKYDANLINKIAISNHAVMISDGFFLHDNNKQPVNMIVQFEPQKPSGNFMFDYYKKKRQDLTPLTIDTTTPKEPEKLGVASCITPDLDKLFNLYTKILDPEESDRDGLS